MKWFYYSLLLLNISQTPIDIVTITENDEPIAAFHRETFISDIPDLQILDSNKLEHFINHVDKEVFQEPKNAYFNENGEIVPEKNGYRLNRHALLEKLYTAFYTGNISIIEVPKLQLFPKVDSELLSQLHGKKLGEYVTYYNNRSSRAHNIALATEAINNTVVFPGEIFSFNKVVGQRTEERGYKKAPEIVKGEFIEGIGGGICQVSSTLYNAVDASGLTITERYSHSRIVPYVPTGRDATVSWYGPDFAFKNEYNQPILIRAKAKNGTLIVTIFSSEYIEYYPRKVPTL